MPTTVKIPLINTNEPDALLAEMHVQEGEPISEGDLLCTLETTKSTNDVIAESSGYIVSLRLQVGQTVRAGELLCYIADAPDWMPEESRIAESKGDLPSPDELPKGLRITRPALNLARESGIDLSRLPGGTLVTEQVVRSLLQKAPGVNFQRPDIKFDAAAIIVYGAGGHGKSVVELLRALGSYRVVGFIDDGYPAGQNIMGIPVLGGAQALTKAQALGVHLAVNAVGGIGNIQARIQVFERLALAGFAFPTVIHPTAFVEASASLAAGVQVFPHAYIGSEASIGFGCIVNTSAIVSHDCQVGDYVNLSPGATLAGAVSIGAGTLVGMRATVNLGASIGAGARIGNGATVKSNLPDGGLVPAGTIWPRG